MGNPRDIWTHESNQAEQIARTLIGAAHTIPMWKRVLFPLALVDLLDLRRKIKNTRQNLLFTKRLAFQAAQAVSDGHDRSLTLGQVDAKTREVLTSQSQGVYTETIRRKQLKEVELLVDHYLKLIQSQSTTYDAMIRNVYESEELFREFLRRLERRENDVIQAAVSTVKTGSRKERISWFKKVQNEIREARMKDVQRIFS